MEVERSFINILKRWKNLQVRGDTNVCKSATVNGVSVIIVVLISMFCWGRSQVYCLGATYFHQLIWPYTAHSGLLTEPHWQPQTTLSISPDTMRILLLPCQYISLIITANECCRKPMGIHKLLSYGLCQIRLVLARMGTFKF
jgi:hypothetical protein